jgi:hypothetical protein
MTVPAGDKFEIKTTLIPVPVLISSPAIAKSSGAR